METLYWIPKAAIGNYTRKRKGYELFGKEENKYQHGLPNEWYQSQ